MLGNISKSRKILEKARQFEAEPDHLLTEALQRLDAGQTTLQMSNILTETGLSSGPCFLDQHLELIFFRLFSFPSRRSEILPLFEEKLSLIYEK